MHTQNSANLFMAAAIVIYADYLNFPYANLLAY